MTSIPEISVILPVYNAGRFLEASINSILHQTFEHFECIIINDGSTDTSEQIIQSFKDDRIIYVKNNQNSGIVFSLNEGLKIARGKYIARMDADDVSYPERLKRQYEYLQENRNVGVCGAYMKVLGKNEVISYPETHKDIAFAFLTYNVIAHPVVMFRKELMDTYGLRYESAYFPAEDYMLWIKCMKFTTLYNIPSPLLEYNIHPGSISQSGQERQLAKTHEVRSIYLLQSLSAYNEESFGRLKSVFSFHFTKEKAELLELKKLFIQLLVNNKNEKIFDPKKFAVFLNIYWYMACKEADMSIFARIQLYLSMKPLGVFRPNSAVKLIGYAILKRI